MAIPDPPDVSPSDLPTFQLVVEFWERFDEEGDIGRTHLESLVLLRDGVTAALIERPRRLDVASRLTAQAFMLVTGQWGEN